MLRLAILFLFCLTSPAVAGGKADTLKRITIEGLAKDHFAQGSALFESENYEAALIEFQAAYNLTHEPDLLHNLSVTYERLGKINDAINAGSQFLREARAKLSEEETDEFEARLQRLKLLQMPIPQKAPTRSLVGPVLTLTIGGALLATGIGCGIAALKLRADLANGSQTYREYSAAVITGEALNGATIAFDAAGALAAVGGGAWLIYSLRK